MSSELGPGLEARPAARQLARSISGMPYREAVFVIDRALDFLSVQLDTHAPDHVVDEAYIDYEAWVRGLDPNSRTIVQQLEYNLLIRMVDQMKNNRRKGPADRREHP